MDLEPLGTFFLGINVSHRLAAILGISAFCFPEQAPWTLFTALICTVLIITSAQNHKESLMSLFVGGSIFAVTAGGLLSASFGTAVIAALTVSRNNRFLALTILVLQLSYLTSIEAIAANFLYQWHLEASAPALLAGTFLLLIQTNFTLWRILLALTPPGLVWISHGLGLDPHNILLISAVPVLLLAALTQDDPRSGREGIPRIVLVGALIIGIAGWVLTPPTTPNEIYVILPESASNPEARFYENYQEVLQFAGIPAKVAKDANEIPAKSLVLLPWLTASDANQEQAFLKRLRELALEREWIVLMVGEHNNMGGVSDKILEITGAPFLRNDLSVPFGNTDQSGNMRSSDIKSWYVESMLNRGASVEVLSILNRVLLSGDGWWAEPDIDEWLWVGDYEWHPQDRHGRLVMAITAVEKNTKWVILGDTGPFINQQLVSDPRPALRILDLATLWPMFFRDIGIAIVGICIILALPFALQLGIISAVVLAALIPPSPINGPWRSLWRQESAFDERNFNLNLISSKTLLTTNWKLERAKNNLSKNLEIPATPTVLFTLVNETLTVGNTKLSNCKRLGSLSTEHVYLMDAQACTVEGDAEILVGDRSEAAILKIGTLLLVLDQNFLGQKAPKINRTWLEKTLSEDPS